MNQLHKPCSLTRSPSVTRCGTGNEFRSVLFVTISLLTLMAGRLISAPGDEDKFVPVTVLKDEKLSSRSNPAQVTHESEDALTKKGYVQIGEISRKEVTGTYWDSKKMPDKAPLRDLTTRLLREAADQGGDLIVLAEDNSPLTMQVTKHGKPTEWYRGSRQVVSQVNDPDGGHHMDYRTEYYQEPIAWETIEGTEYYVRSSGIVWRYDPELAKRIAPKLEAERQARLQHQDTLREAENQASLELQEAERQAVLQRRVAEFYQAVKANDVEKVKALLATGTDFVNAKGDSGVTPLHDAVMGHAQAVAKELLAAGADVNRKSDDGMTPLHLAAYDNDKDSAELLLANGADVSAKSNTGSTALHYAAMNDAKEVAALLLSKGADVKATTNNGRTPLHLAALRNAQAVAELLLAKGAEVNAEDKGGNTPLALTLEGNYAAMAKLLREHGAKE